MTLTLPSLAMRIFRTHYLVKDTIYQLLGKVEQDIRESYTGGAVDVYIPHNRIGSFYLAVKAFFKRLYYYDVNSLYPTVMAKHPMPIGKPIYFEGDIRKVEGTPKKTSNCNVNHHHHLYIIILLLPPLGQSYLYIRFNEINQIKRIFSLFLER